jgi:hypothetical protein
MREIARCRSYAEIQAGLRIWADELGLSRKVIDERSGLQDGYAAKILAENPSKRLGNNMLPLLLETLGAYLVLVVDLAEVDRIRKAAPHRTEHRVRTRPVSSPEKLLVIADYLHSMASRGGKRCLETMTAEQRQRRAGKAIAARYGYRFRG